MGFKQDDQGRIIVAPVPRIGEELIRASHNFTDKTTWYSESTRIISQSLVPTDETNTIFSSSNPDHLYWIDLEHGKVHREDDYKSAYEVVVRVDGETKIQRIWDIETDGDFKVLNYASGTIEFFNAITGSVEADFSVASGSQWILAPKVGKKYDIEDAEGQFSADVQLNDSILFELYGFVDVFAPLSSSANGGSIPPGTKILIKSDEFKTLSQVIDEARGSYPVVPAIGGTRGLQSAMHGFPFRYGTVRTIQNQYGMEVRISLKNNIACEGERITVTFYNVVKDE